MKEKATNCHKNGFSCSESVILSAIDKGLCDKSLLAVAGAFSGGMSSGCLCGAIAGAQMVIGANYGKQNANNNAENARAKAKEFIDEFKKNHRATCCRVLTAGLEGEARRQNCTKLIGECAEILDNLIGEKIC